MDRFEEDLVIKEIHMRQIECAELETVIRDPSDDRAASSESLVSCAREAARLKSPPFRVRFGRSESFRRPCATWDGTDLWWWQHGFAGQQLLLASAGFVTAEQLAVIQHCVEVRDLGADGVVEVGEGGRLISGPEIKPAIPVGDTIEESRDVIPSEEGSVDEDSNAD